MRTAPTLMLAVATVASALVRTRRSHGASGRASTRGLAAPQRRTQVLGQQRRHAMTPCKAKEEGVRPTWITAGLAVVIGAILLAACNSIHAPGRTLAALSANDACG